MVYPEYWNAADVEFADSCEHSDEYFRPDDLSPQLEQIAEDYGPFAVLVSPPGWCDRCGAYFNAEFENRY